MEDENDGGEHTNSEYFKHVWNKPIKVRIEPKKAKMKSKEVIHLRNVLIGTVEHLRRLHHKRKDTRVTPLVRR